MKTAKQLGLTKSQHKNLAKLTIFVRDKVAPPRFNIRKFFIGKDENEDWGHCGVDVCPAKEEYVCGSSACFLGYAIPAGIKAKSGEEWADFGERAFGAEMGLGKDESLYDLLFNDSHENSKSAAVKRGAYFLMYGFPDCDGFLDGWEAPRSFKPDWASIEALANS